MTINNGYVELEEYKLSKEIDDTLDDSSLERIIEAASRAIDMIAWRRFYVTSETRYYTADNSKLIYVDDFTGVTTLKTDEDGDRTYEVTWGATDYDLLPFNAALDGEPYTQIGIAPNGSYGFPTSIAKGVELAASFGYSATPPPAITEACILSVSRLHWREDTPGGATGPLALGQLTAVVMQLRKDPDIMDLLGPFLRRA